jgi:hypothetical protein
MNAAISVIQQQLFFTQKARTKPTLPHPLGITTWFAQPKKELNAR